jgi:hypothetical protein
VELSIPMSSRYRINLAVFWIRIRIRVRRIPMFLGLLNPHPNPLFICPDPAPFPELDPAINKQKNEKKNLISTVL